MAYHDWMDPDSEVTYESRRPPQDPKGVNLRYITGGTRPIAGFGGADFYSSFGDSPMETPQHTYRTINVPGVRLGAGGRTQQQSYTYNVPVANPPGALDSSGYQRLYDAEAWGGVRSRHRLAIPGATEGQFREYDAITDPDTGEVSYEKREGWNVASEEDMLDYHNRHNKAAIGRFEDRTKQKTLERQASEQQEYAKWWNETRYTQLQEMMGQHWQNQMSMMQGLGEAERADILRSGNALQDQAFSRSMQRGMAGTTVLSALQRGASAETSQQLGRFYNQQQQTRLGLQNQMAGQYMNIVEGRVDEYPSTMELAQIMYGAFEGGAGQRQPGSGNQMAMGMGGMALGAGMGMAAAGGAGGLGGLGCLCQIFMEGRHRDGTMDWVVRKYRDENINVRNARGYYKMSEVIVPLMRKSKLMRLFFFLFFIQPCFLWARWHYRDEIKQRGEKAGWGAKIGWVFGPVKRFWEGLCYYLGQDHPYIRWNGELV